MLTVPPAPEVPVEVTVWCGQRVASGSGDEQGAHPHRPSPRRPGTGRGRGKSPSGRGAALDTQASPCEHRDARGQSRGGPGPALRGLSEAAPHFWAVSVCRPRVAATAGHPAVRATGPGRRPWGPSPQGWHSLRCVLVLRAVVPDVGGSRGSADDEGNPAAEEVEPAESRRPLTAPRTQRGPRGRLRPRGPGRAGGDAPRLVPTPAPVPAAPWSDALRGFPAGGRGRLWVDTPAAKVPRGSRDPCLPSPPGGPETPRQARPLALPLFLLPVCSPTPGDIPWHWRRRGALRGTRGPLPVSITNPNLSASWGLRALLCVTAPGPLLAQGTGPGWILLDPVPGPPTAAARSAGHPHSEHRVQSDAPPTPCSGQAQTIPVPGHFKCMYGPGCCCSVD